MTNILLITTLIDRYHTVTPEQLFLAVDMRYEKLIINILNEQPIGTDEDYNFTRLVEEYFNSLFDLLKIHFQNDPIWIDVLDRMASFSSAANDYFRTNSDFDEFTQLFCNFFHGYPET
jgi:hypothetical protein